MWGLRFFQGGRFLEGRILVNSNHLLPIFYSVSKVPIFYPHSTHILFTFYLLSTCLLSAFYSSSIICYMSFTCLLLVFYLSSSLSQYLSLRSGWVRER